MPLRPPAGFISAFFDPLRNPDAPTIGTATAGEASASVTFTAPTNVGGSAISAYSALSTPGGVVGTAASSPISVTGLSNGTAYTFAVWATNTYGPSAYSASTGSVTPTLQRAIFGGGQGTPTSTVQYVSIASSGNSLFFGNLAGGAQAPGACASDTRGVFAGGADVATNVISYITIASVGNATDFGDLPTDTGYVAGCSNAHGGL